VNIWLAYLLRDFSIEKTYRFHFVLKITSVGLQLLVFFFISRFLGKPQYFLFVFVGIIFSDFFQFWLNVVTESIHQEQYWGTMEALFLCPRKPLTNIISSITGKFVFMILEIVFLLVLGKYIFEAAFNFNILFFLPIFIVNALLFGGLGLLSSAFIVYFKRGDPVNWVLSAVFDLLSGIYFPVTVLPDLLKNFSKKLPTTAALDMWRLALIDGRMPDLNQVFAQGLWAVIICFVGALAFRVAYDKTRLNGDLGNY